MDAIEAVARALLAASVKHNLTVDYTDERDGYPEKACNALAQAALSAARPFHAAECAKVARDFDAPHLDGVGERIAARIEETIR